MTNAARTIAAFLCILAAAILAVCLTFEHQACVKLNQDNNALRQKLSQVDKVRAENQRLSNLLAEINTPPSRTNQASQVLSPVDEPARELARLRAEVEALRQQSKEFETLRADTGEARAAAETALKTKSASHIANGSPGGSANDSQFELLRADYWTEKTNMNVAAELRERIRGDSLKAIASNNLKGDPDFGTPKQLTVVYRVGGTVYTNEFREGDFIVLPKEPGQ